MDNFVNILKRLHLYNECKIKETPNETKTSFSSFANLSLFYPSDFKIFGPEDYNISWQTKWQLHTIVQRNSTFSKQKILSCFACFLGA